MLLQNTHTLNNCIGMYNQHVSDYLVGDVARFFTDSFPVPNTALTRKPVYPFICRMHSKSFSLNSLEVFNTGCFSCIFQAFLLAQL